ncbi:winged helix-turn-helix domain-containing protein [Edaphobacter aggregans]|uniref:winged helix-turn-helix domain-containing protein n=1 Tax=Edaphobacter aggregans TaxID=570835 RepID=UPI000558D4D0|nr:winged helix-turn-helix domain-containing protein [Edaphobacter aggregans]
MGMPVNTPRTWRFGVFELDASSGELRRNGTLVKLREQPARILLLLLEHAGQMVTREQLRERLWPSDTFVDFDHSLNSAVMKLREALGDSADKPLYIETTPKKGYRFVAPVSQPEDTQNGGASSRLTAGSEMAVSNTREQSNGSFEVPSNTPDEKQRRRRLLSRKLAVLIVCVVSAIGIGALIRYASLRSLVQFRSQPKPSSGEPNMMSSNLSSSVLTSAPGDARSPSFSPDGRQIAFVWDGVERRHYDIYVQLVGGDTPLQLTHHKSGDGVPGPPQWSPDGREIAFARCNSERDGVYTVPALGGPERRLTDSPCRDFVAGRPIWTPDSKAMVMLDQCAPGGPRAVVLFSFATGEKRCLATGSHGDFAADDALSPDGRTVAFFRYTDAQYSQLYAVPLTGGPPRLVSDGTNFWNPMWTPDGKYIVVYSNRGNMVRPWRVPVAGGPLEPEMVYPGVGSISRDGRRLVYAESQVGAAFSHFIPAAIWRADLSNAGGPVLRTRKLIYSQFMEDAAQPSPDGTRLALQSGRSGTNQIWLNSTDGDHPVQLTNIGEHSGTPRWSPDGRWIAFDARVEDHAHIYVVDVDGRNLHAITHGDSDNVVPSWSRDGRSIYFASPRTGSRQIWKHSLEDGSERRLTEHGGFDPLESYDGRTIYYSKFDEPGIWSMPASGGSESPVVTGKPQVTYFGHWAVTESGLYLLDVDAEPRPTIEFYSFATRRITPVLSLEQKPSGGQPSLSASRDGRTIFYTQSDPQSVIKMVENFRQE